MARALPQFPEGERAVLGALIVDNESYGRIQGVLVPEDFHDSRNRKVFTAMAELREKGEPIDFVTLSGAMKGKDDVPYILDLIDEVPSAANVLHYAGHVKDRALKRQIIGISKEMAKLALQDEKDAGELIFECEEMLGDVRLNYVAISEDTLWRLKKDTETLLNLEEKILAKEIVEEKLASGFLDIDHYTGGFYAGNVVVVAGRSGHGKTAMALDIMWTMAKEGNPCLYQSFEMTRPEVARRIVAKECRVDILDLKRHTITEHELDQIRAKMSCWSNAPFIIDERNLTPFEIAAQVTRLNNRHPDNPIKVVGIDHLQLMGVRDTRNYQRRDLQLGAYMSQLKEMAKNLGLVVIVLSQLNRRVSEKGRSGIPTRADLRDSGAIEENADVIIGVHREYEDSKDEKDKYDADGVIIKNRDGATGRIKLTFKPEWASFTNREKTDRPEPMEPLPADQPSYAEPTMTLSTQEGEFDLFGEEEIF